MRRLDSGTLDLRVDRGLADIIGVTAAAGGEWYSKAKVSVSGLNGCMALFSIGVGARCASGSCLIMELLGSGADKMIGCLFEVSARIPAAVKGCDLEALAEFNSLLADAANNG